MLSSACRAKPRHHRHPRPSGAQPLPCGIPVQLPRRLPVERPHLPEARLLGGRAEAVLEKHLDLRTLDNEAREVADPGKGQGGGGRAEPSHQPSLIPSGSEDRAGSPGWAGC